MPAERGRGSTEQSHTGDARESSFDRPRLPGTAANAKSRIRDVGAELQHPCMQYQRFYNRYCWKSQANQIMRSKLAKQTATAKPNINFISSGFPLQNGAQGSGRPAGVPLKPPARGQPARRELQERSGNGAPDPITALPNPDWRLRAQMPKAHAGVWNTGNPGNPCGRVEFERPVCR